MTEPLFFDCLTDAQFWSLFDSGVLRAYLLPGEVFQRLQRLAPAHDCYLFAWPGDRPLPLLQDILPSLALFGQQSPQQAHRDPPQTPTSAERMRAEIEAFFTSNHADVPTEGGRIYVITMHPDIELRAGPYLEPTARDLAAMSVPELEAYVDAMLRLDDGNDLGAAIPSPSIDGREHAPPWISGARMTGPI